MKKSVLVTGAGGYIGSHVCKALHDSGKYIITGADCNWPNKVDEYLDHKRPYFNVCEPNYSAGHLPPDKFDVVIHLAAKVQVAESMVRPTMYYDVNVKGTQSMFNKFKTPHFIFASSAGVLDPVSPYAISKLMCEHLIQEELPNNSTICRFSNVAGNNGIFTQSGPVSHLVRVASKVAAGKLDTLTIFGNDYDTFVPDTKYQVDGTCVRDYIHVCDLAAGILNIIEAGPQQQIQNFGSGKLTSNLQVATTMQRVSGVDFPVKFGPRRSGDPAILAFDKISQYLNHKHTLEDMCSSAYNIEKETA
jgi:UDP-glucose 4-epimerase